MLRTLYANEDLTMEEMEERFMQENRSTSIIQRLIRPEEIANLVTFFKQPAFFCDKWFCFKNRWRAGSQRILSYMSWE